VYFSGTWAVKIVSQQIHPFYSIRQKMMFGNVLEHFVSLPCVKRCKTCVSGPNALFRGYSSSKNGFAPNASILLRLTKNNHLRSILGHFINLPRAKRWKTCVSVPNALFQGTQVAKMVLHLLHQLYSFAPKMMFGSVLEPFRNVRNVTNAKNVFRAWMHYFGEPKLRK
jgi:hypothetical protein